jgi:hypothetical protein
MEVPEMYRRHKRMARASATWKFCTYSTAQARIYQPMRLVSQCLLQYRTVISIDVFVVRLLRCPVLAEAGLEVFFGDFLVVVLTMLPSEVLRRSLVHFTLGRRFCLVGGMGNISLTLARFS